METAWSLGRLLFSVLFFTAYKRYSCTGQIITPHESSNMRILLLQRAERRDLDKGGNANGAAVKRNLAGILISGR